MSNAAISPGDFRRPYITGGHAAQNAQQWTGGVPDRPTPVGILGRTARTGPAGPAGPAGSGTADRSMPGEWAGDHTPDGTEPEYGNGGTADQIARGRALAAGDGAAGKGTVPGPDGAGLEEPGLPGFARRRALDAVDMPVTLREGRAAAKPGSATEGLPADVHEAAHGGPVPHEPPRVFTSEDGVVVGVTAKAGLVPSRFHRPYLAAGHQADSPANTGRRGVTVIPETAAAEPQDYTRGWIRPGHQAEPPADDPGGNNPHPPGSLARTVHDTAAGRYEANQQQARTEHVMPSQAITASPSVSRVALPQDKRASAVPASLTVSATRAAPGESR